MISETEPALTTVDYLYIYEGANLTVPVLTTTSGELTISKGAIL